MPRLLNEAPKGWIDVRGFVGVAGRTKRLQRSSRKRRWRIRKGAYTAITGAPNFTPFSVLWRDLYVRLPENAEAESHRDPNAGPPLARGQLRYALDEAMSRFDARPDREELSEALNGTAK